MKRGAGVFFAAFLIRLIAAGITTLTDLNPESQHDAVRFAGTAEKIASGLSQGYLVIPDVNFIYQQWGLFLAPYWLLPGPSGFYGRVGNAFLGAFAVYNVYVITRYYHSYQAGILAVTPLVFYPSIVAVHSTLLREAIVLFGITTAVRLTIVPSKDLTKLPIYGIAGFLVFVAYIHRPANEILYIAAIGIGILVYLVDNGFIPKRLIGIGVGCSPLLVLASWEFIQSGIEYLARTRDVRGGGRTDYLLQIIPETLLELTAFSWIGAAYFLYAPFPWMIETVPDLLVSIEGVITMAFTVAALWGVRTLAAKNKPATAALVVGLFLAVVFYGVGTVNFGTGMRHRQMFSWIIFLFGGIGIAEHVRFVGLSDTIQSQPDETASD